MNRHSSRRSKALGHSFLASRLRGARSYDRIAGYFSSSILEVAGEELESIRGKVRIVCNSELQAADVSCARNAMLRMKQEWHRQDHERHTDTSGDRFARLAHFLTSGKLEVRVLPDSAFGLIHGKAGVIDLPDEQAVAPGESFEKFSPSDRKRMTHLQDSFGREHSPFIRHIIRRTRSFLETEIDPETNQPYLDPVEVELLGEGEDGAVTLTPYLAQAYELATKFCQVVARRTKSAGFLKTLLLKRAGSSIVAGIATAQAMLENWESLEDEDDSEFEGKPDRDFKTLGKEERALLESYLAALESNQAEDPKFAVVARLLRDGHPTGGNQPWQQLGCIIFSQYYDSAKWLAQKLSQEVFPETKIGLYAGSGKSAFYQSGTRQPADRDDLKHLVKTGEVKVLVGTDAASEGLNLQTLGTLINLDLPWNPTRLEQRKGRIQRIGQRLEKVFVYNLRYRDSIEDRVHRLLSERLAAIHDLFGQIPDTLEAAWIETALGNNEAALREIDALPTQHPFEARYNQISQVDFESCSKVLNRHAIRSELESGW